VSKIKKKKLLAQNTRTIWKFDSLKKKKLTNFMVHPIYIFLSSVNAMFRTLGTFGNILHWWDWQQDFLPWILLSFGDTKYYSFIVDKIQLNEWLCDYFSCLMNCEITVQQHGSNFCEKTTHNLHFYFYFTLILQEKNRQFLDGPWRIL
jgi:hypothetical protein